MRIRKRNRMLRRIVLGFAVVALAVPSAAIAGVDEGLGYQPSQSADAPVITFREYDPSANAGAGTPIGLPNAGLNDYLKSRDGIEVVRLQPRSTLRDTDTIEQVRVSPRDVSAPQVVASPGIDWGDAAIGAALAVGLMLLGGAAFYSTRHLGKAQTA
jgi:hypothetical protein